MGVETDGKIARNSIDEIRTTYDAKDGEKLQKIKNGINEKVGVSQKLSISESGTKNNRHHEMCAKVTRNGKDVVKERYYISGGGKGGYRDGLLYHTERKFLRDVKKKILSKKVIAGDQLNMKGVLDPCRPGCQPAIREFVKENDVIAVYESSTKTFYWRPFNDIKLKGSVLQTVEDKDGKSVSWRYWQNDKGYWKRAIYKEKK